MLSEIDLSVVLRPTLVDVGEIVYPPGGRLGPRWQRSLDLLLIRSGSCRVWIDDRPPFIVPADWVSLQLPGHRERYEFGDDAETHEAWVALEAEDCPQWLLERLEALPFPLLLPISSALANLVAAGIAQTRTPLSTERPLVAALAAAAIWRFVGEAESSVRPSDDAVERARRFLSAHLDDRTVDLGQVANAAHVSAPHLVRRFRKELGVTPMAYLWHRRIETGVDLLRSTGLPIGEVARRSGFASVYHFSRRVKAHTGLAPTEVRRERWRSPEARTARGRGTA